MRAEFMAEAEAADRPASQVVRELMRDHIEHRRQARDYNNYMHHKVEAGCASMRAGRGGSNGQIVQRYRYQTGQFSISRFAGIEFKMAGAPRVELGTLGSEPRIMTTLLCPTLCGFYSNSWATHCTKQQIIASSGVSAFTRGPPSHVFSRCLAV